jgi:tRNA(adenine34) deaminase
MKSESSDPMAIAFAEAEAAASRYEVPVGAVVTDGAGTIIARAGNRTIELRDPTAHAEMMAIRSAALMIQTERLSECSIYVTLEPCAMCAAAISFARFRKVVFAAEDEKMGAIENGPRFYTQPTCHHKPEVVSGIGAERSAAMLKRFFADRR